MTIQFCGAAQHVTGSAHLITLDDGYKILLDCGLYQGYDEEMEHFNSTWLFKPEELDCVILSHAHIDHSGRLPRLVRDGFSGNIYSTHATFSLCSIMLLDSAFIQMRDAEYYNKKRKPKIPKVPLYTDKDIKPTMEKFVAYPYEDWFSIREGVEVLFRDAGHILGSASVSLRIRENGKTLHFAFTGDVGRPDRPILRDPQPMPEADYVVTESTYGDRVHLEKPHEEQRFLNIIRHTCVEKKGKLIIPAFSVGRTQEIVYMLDQMETAGVLPKIPVYVDSPLAVNATVIFGSHPECYDNQLNEYLLKDDNPFGFNDLHYIRSVDDSKALNDKPEPCIIISASGMMNAGRVKHHLANNLANKKNTILVVGYCSPGTPGAKLTQGADELRLFGRTIPVRADVEVMDSFSAHADKNELLKFLENQSEPAREIFLVHGEPDAQKNFKNMLKEAGFADVKIPSLGQEFALK